MDRANEVGQNKLTFSIASEALAVEAVLLVSGMEVLSNCVLVATPEDIEDVAEAELVVDGILQVEGSVRSLHHPDLATRAPLAMKCQLSRLGNWLEVHLEAFDVSDLQHVVLRRYSRVVGLNKKVSQNYATKN